VPLRTKVCLDGAHDCCVARRRRRASRSTRSTISGLALDEVFSLLADRHAGERVRTTFRVDGRQISASLSAGIRPIDVKPDEAGSQHLEGQWWTASSQRACRHPDQGGLGDLSPRRLDDRCTGYNRRT
jgi:hypothetical protein